VRERGDEEGGIDISILLSRASPMHGPVLWGRIVLGRLGQKVMLLGRAAVFG